MRRNIDECDFWWFRELYSILLAFADEPHNTINRHSHDEFAVPETQGQALASFRESVLAKYPEAESLRVMQLVNEINSTLNRKSLGGEEFEADFWTNDAFHEHTEWLRIRELTRSFLLR